MLPDSARRSVSDFCAGAFAQSEMIVNVKSRGEALRLAEAVYIDLVKILSALMSPELQFTLCHMVQDPISPATDACPFDSLADQYCCSSGPFQLSFSA